MREYTVPGPSGDMTVMLSDDDAKARGLAPAAEAPTKAKQPANKQAAPSNKASTAANKGNA